MRNALFLTIFFCGIFYGFSQEKPLYQNKYPVFPNCENQVFKNLEICFDQQLNEQVNKEFKVPQEVKDDGFHGKVIVLFEITPEGIFNVLYVDAYTESLKEEVQRVFDSLPKVKPATHNGRPTYAQFRLSIKIPLSNNSQELTNLRNYGQTKPSKMERAKNEYDSIENHEKTFKNRQASSHINIPLSHEVYNRFDQEMNRVGTNAHTESKPFLYSEVKPYYDFETENDKLKWKEKSWFGRKLFNEHLVRLQGEDYWFTADIAADLQIGKDFDADYSYTYNNTRAAMISGGLGKSFNFNVVVYESQGKFAQYFNQYARSLNTGEGGTPGIVPGRAIAKNYGNNNSAFDYLVSTGYISYNPSKYFNFQLGHGKNFIGDGYRSMLLSDVGNPYPYFKISTTFWKLKYTNTWASLRDVRLDVASEGSYRTKYMANHYLSYNVTKRLNIGLFESVLWDNGNDRGFDFNYLNPIIFYRAIEFSTGPDGGNALIGLSGKYKWSDNFNTYGQLAIDEFSSANIFSTDGSYKNKLGYQLGFKYYNAFKVDNLNLQVEYNQARPYTYSHNDVVLNYGNNNQPLAHLWGANFREFIAIARYKRKRMFGHAKFIYGKRGFELNKDLDPFYGGDIYGSENNRIKTNGNDILQGNTSNYLYGELKLGYILNPATNLKIYASLIYRDVSPKFKDTVYNYQKGTTTWINFGFRTDLFNWYYDY